MTTTTTSGGQPADRPNVPPAPKGQLLLFELGPCGPAAPPGYRDYLTSAVWAAIRAWQLSRVPYCQLCGTRNALEVHHNRYPARWGTEDVADLTTLCARCHSRHHGSTRSYRTGSRGPGR